MVDNELDVNITIKTALEENGDFEVDTFNDAESALFAFKPGHYDLAILDIKMPGTNGFQIFDAYLNHAGAAVAKTKNNQKNEE